MSDVDLQAKLARLLDALDSARPGLGEIRGAANPAEALLAALGREPRGRFRFEYQRPADLRAFLGEHYRSWRAFDYGEAERLAGMSLEAARGDRALAGVPALGRAWLASGDPKWGRAFERFYGQSETGSMFNWYSFNGSQGSIELSAYFLLQDCPGFSVEGRIAFLDHLLGITADAWDTHTSQWPQNSLGTEGHNWYLHGMHVLPFFGLLFPEFKRAAFFLGAGWSVVEEHVRGHYKADGGARETTLGYQVGNMHCLWDFYLIAHRNGHPMSAGFADRLLRGTRFLLALATPGGRLPSYGDTVTAHTDLTGLAATAAALTGDRECKWYAEHFRSLRAGGTGETPGQIPEAAFWAVGLEGAATYAQTRPRDPRHVSVLMGPTGYAALRQHAGDDAAYLALAAADRGPIVTSHGHNEILGLEVHAAGQRFLGVPGCAPYGNSPGRDYDQRTEAHNCLAIDGLEQTPVINEWRWASVVTPAVRRWISEPTHDFIHAVHEGYYLYGQRDTLHARKVFFAKAVPGPQAAAGPYWIVMDWVESLQEQPYRVYWHGCVEGRIHEAGVILGSEAGPRLAILPPAGDGLTPAPVWNTGREAYLSELKLDPRAHPCFSYAKRADSDCLVWVLVPLQPGQAIPRVERVPVSINGKTESAHGGSAVRVRFREYEDLLCVSHKDFDADLEFAGQKAWGHLAFRRLGPGGAALAGITHTMADGECGR